MKLIGRAILVVLLVALAVPAAAKEKEKERDIKIGDKFRDFRLPDVDGRILRTKSLRKRKVLVLEFSTSWCKNCTKQLKEMQILARKVDRKRVQIIEVNVLSPRSHVLIELEEQERNQEYPVLLDPYKTIANGFFTDKTPKIFIVDTKGVIRFKGHMASWKELKKEIDKWLKDEKRQNDD